jgi:hypothetical protein
MIDSNKQFREWYVLNECAEDWGVSYHDFLRLHWFMQKGVYEEFFREQGVQLNVELISIDKAFELLSYINN